MSATKKKGVPMSDEKKETANTTVERKLASAEEFSAAARVRYSEVDAPELGEGRFLKVRGMSAQHAHFFMDPDQTPAARAARLPGLIAECLVNDDGSHMLTEEQASAVAESNLGLFMRITNALFEISGIAATKTAEGGPKAG